MRVKSVYYILLMTIILVAPIYGINNTIGSKELSAPIDVQKELDLETMTSSLRNKFFTKNIGQWREDIEFIGSTDFGLVSLGRNHIEYVIINNSENKLSENEEPRRVNPISTISNEHIKLQIMNSKGSVPVGRDALGSYSNYFFGNDSNKWISNAGHFGTVSYTDVWNDIDIKFYFDNLGLKYDIILHPGADPNDIEFQSNSWIGLGENINTLVLRTSNGSALLDGNLYTYQLNNKKEIRSEYKLRLHNSYGFILDEYDTSKTVIIDPLVYSSYIGGSRYDECFDLELDENENIFVIGSTASDDFFFDPEAYDGSYNGAYDLFIMKFDPTGTQLQFTTFLGTEDQEYRGYMEINSNGDLVILGNTGGNNFPVTEDVYDSVANGNEDMTLSILSPDGKNLTASTYFGGTDHDLGYALELDDNDRVYVTGYSWSINLPTTTGVINQTAPGGHHDTFVSCFSSDLSTLEKSTYLGGSNRDEGYGISVGNEGNILITGETLSPNFPTTVDALEKDHMGGADGFLTVLNSNMSSIIYSTFIGGSSYDRGYDLEIGRDMQLYITGYSTSEDFPITPGAYKKIPHDIISYDVFLMKFNTMNWNLEYSTLIGGDGRDYGMSIRIDDRGQAYITGFTESDNFPITFNAAYKVHNLNKDVFILFFNLTTNKILYSSYMGGQVGGNEVGFEIELTNKLDVWIVGYTSDSMFNTTSNAFDDENPGGNEGILFKFHIPDPPDPPTGLDFTLMNGSIKLDWIEPQSPGDERLIGYHIYKGVNGSKLNYYKSIEIKTYFEDYNIENWNTYQYLITAYSWIGESIPTETVTIKDSIAPILDQDLTEKIGFTGEDHEFRFRILDNIALLKVVLKVEIGSVETHINLTYDDDNDEWFSINKISNTFAGELRYRVWSQDVSLNVNETTWMIVDIQDRLLPQVIEDLSEHIVEAGHKFTFEVQAYDNIGVDEVLVEYSFWDGRNKWTKLTMNSSDSEIYTREIEIGMRIGTISYFYNICDIYDNWNKSIHYTREISDDEPPTFNFDLSNEEATTGDSFTFRVDISDNVGLIGNYVEYWINNGKHMNLTLMGTEKPSATIKIPNNDLGELKFIFSSQDLSGNWASTEIFNRAIIDNDPPVLDSEWKPEERIGTGDILSIQIPINDNIELGNINVYYAFGDKEYTEESIFDGSTVLPFNLSVPLNWLGILRIKISCMDTSGNIINTPVHNITVIDNKNPTISQIDKIMVDQNENFNIQILADDNIGINEIIWEGFPINHSGNSFNGSIEDPGTYTVKVIVYDEAGNSETITFILTIMEVEDEPSSARSLFIILGILSIIIFVVVIMAIMVLMRKRKKTEAEPSSSKEEESVQEEVNHSIDNLESSTPNEEQSSFLDYSTEVPFQNGLTEEPVRVIVINNQQ